MGRLAKEESGAALGLAIVMIVLISVMGAGLLTFVMTDLNIVVESNKGQRALDIADAGVEASRIKLLAEAHPSAYDDGWMCEDPATGQPSQQNAPCAGANSVVDPGYISHACNADGGWNALPIPRDGEVAGGGFWNPDYGVTRRFAGGSFYVELRYLSPNSKEQRCKSPLSRQTQSDESRVPNRDKTYPIPRIDAGYYGATSTACYPGGIDGNGNCLDSRASKRRVDAVFETRELGVPLAIYTQNRATDSVILNGSACVQDVNVFSMGGVQVNGTGGCSGAGTPAGSDPRHLRDSGSNDPNTTTVTKFGGIYGGPFDYGDWVRSEFDNLAHLDGSARYEDTTPTDYYFNADNRFNTTPRTSVSPGIGAAGTISKKVEGRDYDQASSPGFVRKDAPTASQPGDRITFPFDYASVEGQRDLDRMGLLRSEALRQEEYNEAGQSENYVEASGGTVSFTSEGGVGLDSAYRWPQYRGINEFSPAAVRPQTSNLTTVVYVKFTDNSPADNVVTWNVDHDDGCGDDPEKGTLVVENGSVEVVGDRTPFHGMVITRGADPDRDGAYNEGAGDQGGNFTQDSGACTGGGVDATGGISLSGTTTNINPNDSSNLGHNSGFSVKEVDMLGAAGFHSVRLWSWRESYR